MTAPLTQLQIHEAKAEKPRTTAVGSTPTQEEPRAAESPATPPEPGSAELAPYWVERKRYLKQLRKVPELRQRFWSALLMYTLRRVLWSFGFFPVFIAFWVPLVMASFNPVVMVTNILPDLQAFVAANPEMQANTTQTIVVAWLSVGFFFLIFDFVLTPFRSPYEYEADVYMRAWEQRQPDAPATDAPEGDAIPGKV